MAIPKVFKKIDNSDFTIRPFKVNKNWNVNNTNYSSSYCVTINRAITPIQTNFYNNRLWQH